MGQLTLLYLPYRYQWDQAGGDDVQQQEGGQGPKRDQDLHRRRVISAPVKGQPVARQEASDDDVSLQVHAHIDTQDDREESTRRGAHPSAPQRQPGDDDVADEHHVPQTGHWPVGLEGQQLLSHGLTAVPFRQVVREEEVGPGEREDQDQLTQGVQVLLAQEVVQLHGLAQDEQHSGHR